MFYQKPRWAKFSINRIKANIIHVVKKKSKFSKLKEGKKERERGERERRERERRERGERERERERDCKKAKDL